jgi:hypothetical protein
MIMRSTALSFILALGFVAGCTAGKVKAPADPQDKGGYFCCDQAGKPCVYSPDGDCQVPVQWCSEIRTDSTGQTTCATW